MAWVIACHAALNVATGSDVIVTLLRVKSRTECKQITVCVFASQPEI